MDEEVETSRRKIDLIWEKIFGNGKPGLVSDMRLVNYKLNGLYLLVTKSIVLMWVILVKLMNSPQ